MSKHTDGPWKVDLEFDKRPTVWTDENENDRTRVARICCDPPNVDAVAYENALADAHLIAAAPDLLQMLEVLVSLKDSTEATYEDAYEAFFKGGAEEMWALARAAIAKATGK